MKQTKATDLRQKSISELEELVATERAALYATRRDLVLRQTSDRTSLKQRRHNIARMLTIIDEKKMEEATN